MNVSRFKDLPILGILRDVDSKTIEPLTEAVISAGLRTLEIAMNTPDAPALIKQLNKAAAGRLMIGAGTVLTMQDLHAALDAGATFIVLPTLVEEVLQYCVKNSIPVFPGAFSPQEIYNAWSAGATMVKVFPAKFFGPAYIKEMKGPFKNIELLSCGGITTENIRSFFSAGASAAAFGSSIFRPDLIKAGQFNQIKHSITTLISAYKSL